uniref:Uncharacterized protein n=1 Tax=viral metagenome TaxID=1070528 RepID=A0A6C0BD70_9ZZZZ
MLGGDISGGAKKRKAPAKKKSTTKAKPKKSGARK